MFGLKMPKQSTDGTGDRLAIFHIADSGLAQPQRLAKLDLRPAQGVSQISNSVRHSVNNKKLIVSVNQFVIAARFIVLP